MLYKQVHNTVSYPAGDKQFGTWHTYTEYFSQSLWFWTRNIFFTAHFIFPM